MCDPINIQPKCICSFTVSCDAARIGWCIIAKFHYTDTDTDPTEFRRKKSLCPCRARVVEFSYKDAFWDIHIPWITWKTNDSSVGLPMARSSHAESGSWNESLIDADHCGELSHRGRFIALCDRSICNTAKHSIHTPATTTSKTVRCRQMYFMSTGVGYWCVSLTCVLIQNWHN